MHLLRQGHDIRKRPPARRQPSSLSHSSYARSWNGSWNGSYYGTNNSSARTPHSYNGASSYTGSYAASPFSSHAPSEACTELWSEMDLQDLSACEALPSENNTNPHALLGIIWVDPHVFVAEHPLGDLLEAFCTTHGLKLKKFRSATNLLKGLDKRRQYARNRKVLCDEKLDSRGYVACVQEALCAPISEYIQRPSEDNVGSIFSIVVYKKAFRKKSGMMNLKPHLDQKCLNRSSSSCGSQGSSSKRTPTFSGALEIAIREAVSSALKNIGDEITTTTLFNLLLINSGGEELEREMQQHMRTICLEETLGTLELDLVYKNVSRTLLQSDDDGVGRKVKLVFFVIQFTNAQDCVRYFSEKQARARSSMGKNDSVEKKKVRRAAWDWGDTCEALRRRKTFAPDERNRTIGLRKKGQKTTGESSESDSEIVTSSTAKRPFGNQYLCLISADFEHCLDTFGKNYGTKGSPFAKKIVFGRNKLWERLASEEPNSATTDESFDWADILDEISSRIKDPFCAQKKTVLENTTSPQEPLLSPSNCSDQQKMVSQMMFLPSLRPLGILTAFRVDKGLEETSSGNLPSKMHQPILLGKLSNLNLTGSTNFTSSYEDTFTGYLTQSVRALPTPSLHTSSLPTPSLGTPSLPTPSLGTPGRSLKVTRTRPMHDYSHVKHIRAERYVDNSDLFKYRTGLSLLLGVSQKVRSRSVDDGKKFSTTKVLSLGIRGSRSKESAASEEESGKKNIFKANLFMRACSKDASDGTKSVGLTFSGLKLPEKVHTRGLRGLDPPKGLFSIPIHKPNKTSIPPNPNPVVKSRRGKRGHRRMVPLGMGILSPFEIEGSFDTTLKVSGLSIGSKKKDKKTKRDCVPPLLRPGVILNLLEPIAEEEWAPPHLGTH